MVAALIDLSVAVPVSAGLFIGAGFFAGLAVVLHRRENPPTEKIRRRGTSFKDTEEDAEVR